MPERVCLNSSYLNAKSTTGTLTRVRDTSSLSGMCPICIYDCPVVCQIGLAAFRGREAIYPISKYFGYSTAGALKDFGLDWSHFNIQAGLIGAEGIEPNSDKAVFPAVSTEAVVGGVRLKLPVIIGAYGSTDVAKVNWEGLAKGAAISGIAIIVGENVCGVDPDAQITDGKVTYSKELEYRIKSYRKFWDGKYGDIIVQTNVEDQRLGVDVYAISKLEVDCIERKWGQGAKSIGGEIRIRDLDRAIQLKKRGYIIIPDPEDPRVREAFKQKLFDSFERHSRVGMPKEKDILEDVDWLKSQGAKRVSLKTGAYRPAAVAFTMKMASEAKFDYVTFDGAGGGTGMSPVPMMDEMGIPTVYLEAIVLKCAQILKRKGKHVPDLVMAGGFIEETQILKALALSNFGDGPLVKGVVMARAPLTAVMKANYFVKLAQSKKLPKSFAEEYGIMPERFFRCSSDLKDQYGDRFKEISWGAIGLYSYLYDKVRVSLQQLLAGIRKFQLYLINRNDLVALTEIASKSTGIPMPHESETGLLEEILS
ncbi:TPA: FMN-binding glutamate synthase family protein [Candidatus Bathyarchaeota archaeon]|nr:FMN-binding glutamate synthase family protein [Candidatus Bathyarchaeota archaeon]